MNNRQEVFKVKRTGSSQTSRNSVLLDASKLRLDDRRLADFITFCFRLSEKVNFFDLNNDVKGTWKPFFGADESILLARISIMDIDVIDDKYKATLKSFEQEYDEELKTDCFIQLFRQIIALALRLDSWYQISLNYNLQGQDTGLGIQIKTAIQYKLGGVFNELVEISKAFDERVADDKKINIEKYEFDRIWRSVESTDSDEESFESTDHWKVQMTTVSKHLTLIFRQFLSAIAYVVSLAPSLLEHSLQNDHSHSPQNALFITFLRLYQHVVDDLNDITKKHLDYYFRELLEQKQLKAEADKVFLSFLLADNVDQFRLTKGTLLEAGTDEEGLSYLYQCDNDLLINKATINDVKVLFLSKNPDVKYEEKFKQVANIYHAHVASNPDGNIDFLSQPMIFPPFGEEQFGVNPEHPDMIQSEIGFAIAAPILILKEGVRTINLNFKFDLKSMSSLVSFLEKFTLHEKLTAEGAFFKIFSEAFKLTISTIEGWHEIKDYRVSPPEDWSEGMMKASFVLDQSSPAFEPFEEGAEEAAPFSTPWPIVRFLLSADDTMYAYSYLNELQIEYCEIEVDVQKVKNLKLFNNLGKLDTGSPFFPFGSVPNLGSYLIVGHDEIDIKPIEDVILNLEWHNIPLLEGGFKEYYQEYGENIENDSFKVNVKALSGYEFMPQDEGIAEKFQLFRTTRSFRGETPHNQVEPKSTIEIRDTQKLDLKADYSYLEIPDYDNTVKSGYLKLELVEPAAGFGHEIYPGLFASIVTKNANSSPKAALDLPKNPYIPQLRSLEMNYKARTRIMMAKDANERGSDPSAEEKVYHIQPFGIRTIFQEGKADINDLVPQYHGEGYLLMGFQHLNGGEILTIYFALEEDIGNDFEVELPKVHWLYLSNNQWIELSERDIVFDGTNDFTASGIVKLKIPKDATHDNSILPSGKIWLGAKVNGDVSLLSKTKGIYTQAVSASWVPNKEGAEWASSIPAQTISSFATSKSEIATILQPEASFHGKYKESESKFYLRVSERLRHKNRAVTTWDFEQLLLNKYPFVNQVQCLTNLHHEKVKPGHMLLVVVREINRDRPFYYPKLSYDTLEHLQRFVSKLSTPFAQVRLVNPVYEQVKVNANIRFVDNKMKGIYLQQLNDDIRQFLCPWFYNEKVDMTFGGDVRLEDVFAFIEDREYVEFATKVSIVVIHNKDQMFSLSDSAREESGVVELTASNPWSVLVPVENHQFTVIEDDEYQKPERAAIEKMTLGEDFVLAPESDESKVGEHLKEDSEDDDYYIIEFGDETLRSLEM